MTGKVVYEDVVFTEWFGEAPELWAVVCTECNHYLLEDAGVFGVIGKKCCVEGCTANAGYFITLRGSYAE